MKLVPLPIFAFQNLILKMSQEHEAAFELFDEYSRGKHNSFLCEMFMNSEKTEYVLCFRPVGDVKDSSDSFASRYIRFPTPQVKQSLEQGILAASIKDQLDKELGPLGLKE